VNDEPSLGELGRLIQALRGDVRDDMAQINSRLDRLVSMDVYTVERAALVKDIADLTKDMEQLASKQQQDVDKINRQRSEDANRVTQTRRWLVASVLIPLLGLILPVIMFLAGGK
jgi:t-SNARE complex subunit (syntaxin)